jgi:hypothetical protein
VTVVQSLLEVMREVTAIEKGDRNDFHKFLFRGIDRVINQVGPALRTHGVLILPTLHKLESRDVTTEKGKLSREVTVEVAYTFYGPEGDQLVCVVPGEAQDTGDKAVSKAMSVAFRTALIQALTIPTEQQDPDAQTYTRKPDALTAWKNKLMEEAKRREWDVDQLAHEFHEWSMGADIRDANADTLQKFHQHLVPPKTRTVSRSGTEPTGDAA